MIEIRQGKRKEYLEAWAIMLDNQRALYKKDWRMKHVWPGRFTELQTEVNNFCTIAFDGENPVGIFGIIETKYGRALGKQIVVDPTYRGQKIGQALIIANEKQLRESTDIREYTIVCLDTTAGIYKKHWGLEPFKGPLKFREENGIKIGYESHFRIPLYRDNFYDQYNQIMSNFIAK